MLGAEFLCGLVAPIESRKRPGSAAKVLLDVFRVIEGRGAGDTAGARTEDVKMSLSEHAPGLAMRCRGRESQLLQPDCRIVMGGSHGEDSPSVP